MRFIAKIALIVVACICIFPTMVWAEEDVKDAVVKVFVAHNGHDYDNPWMKSGQKSSTGSGCVIAGKRILTNAHVVSDQTFIQVKKAGDAKKYIAKLKTVAHDCDLAILSVKDDAFFDDVRPIRIGDLPKVRDRVAVYGFPEGGDELSITEGVVSRVENSFYSHSFANLLTCQIDAAINPGNSGGPVLKGDLLVGVAFQAYSPKDTENIGYMIPSPVIKHFLTDISDGKYDGFPALGISVQEMENPDLRRNFGMDSGQSGVLLKEIYLHSPVRGVLQEKDVILSADGVEVANDGSVEFRKGDRTSFTYLAQNKQINDSLKLRILRQGQFLDVKIRLTRPLNFARLVPYEQYDRAPTYYILGGLVFQPLTVNYLKTSGEDWILYAPVDLLNYYIYGKRTHDRRQIVVLTKVLADEINVGYSDLKDRVISHVNGKKISNMKDLVNAFENNQGKYHIIVDERGDSFVLEKQKVDEYGPNILKNYSITSNRSSDLEQTPATMQGLLLDSIKVIKNAGL